MLMLIMLIIIIIIIPEFTCKSIHLCICIQLYSPTHTQTYIHTYINADILQHTLEDSVAKENTYRYRIAGYESRFDYVLSVSSPGPKSGYLNSGLERYGEPIIWTCKQEETSQEKEGRKWVVSNRSPVYGDNKQEQEHPMYVLHIFVD